MKGFALDENGDLEIKKGAIQMTNGEALRNQKIQTVLGTNKGEWFLNIEEGVDFSKLLGRNRTEEEMRFEVERALRQVDESIVLDELMTEKRGRTLRVKFKAHTEKGETIEGAKEWR